MTRSKLAVREGEPRRVGGDTALADARRHLAGGAHRRDHAGDGVELGALGVERDDVRARLQGGERVAPAPAPEVEHDEARAHSGPFEIDGQHGRPPSTARYSSAVASATRCQLNRSSTRARPPPRAAGRAAGRRGPGRWRRRSPRDRRAGRPGRSRRRARRPRAGRRRSSRPAGRRTPSPRPPGARNPRRARGRPPPTPRRSARRGGGPVRRRRSGRRLPARTGRSPAATGPATRGCPTTTRCASSRSVRSFASASSR